MKTILVIEDEAEALENLVLMLEMEGYRALGAANGRRGVELARRERPDLVLCDISMPELDGYGVLAALRASPATAATPFVFLTARGDKQELRRGMNLGADDYLTKPASAEDVLAAVKMRLQRDEVSRRSTMAQVQLQPDYTSSAPLRSLGLTAREAEVLLWLAQGKSNSDIAGILGCAENTVKVHLARIFEKLGVENRNAAAMRAIDVLLRGSSKQAGTK